MRLRSSRGKATAARMGQLPLVYPQKRANTAWLLSPTMSATSRGLFEEVQARNAILPPSPRSAARSAQRSI